MSGYFDRFVADSRRLRTLVVQPRMGMGNIHTMRAGLRAVADLGVRAVGTVTIDSYTRVGDYTTSLERLALGEELNGYPLVSHPTGATRDMLHGLYGPGFPVQVRHGTARPQRVFERLVEIGLDATEGGPVSYCLPYSRLPLADAVTAWAESCRFLAGTTEHGHIESFGGCLLGQLCPPSLLVAMGILEGRFFRQHGVRHLSLSYAQGTLAVQDRGALRALRALAAEYLGDTTWHVVLYTYMGLFPRTPDGAGALIRDSARLARDAGCERMIVKTVSEAWQIPSVSENLSALTLAADDPGTRSAPSALEDAFFEETLAEARLLVDAVLNLDADVGAALVAAFGKGLLDIPFCLHPDNRAAATCVIDDRGALAWGERGGLPLPKAGAGAPGGGRLGSDALYDMLNHVANRYDTNEFEWGSV
ncbi:methylaspartate mutase [Streptomyces xanthochromogenes]|uniref:Methylaspartate mutase n=1 Tax=Streptomyces xanthochromogenes TaxID=67384 RepID=A0ABQ2ZQ93_9ACTN|nr:methylaspartate mutase [Streptomyces xanthochromogenes]MYV92889.1 methylaspartate mutase [Streptomyces sp. SID1034]GGY20034.1 methylaspartate mutase [Streptomyces xanthochromogenes]